MKRAILHFSLVLSLLGAAPAHAQIFKTFPVTLTTQTGYIVTGADGNLWFTEPEWVHVGGTGLIGRLTTSGVVTEFSKGLEGYTSLAGITRGPDGNVWFVDEAHAGIGYISRSGVITVYENLVGSDTSPVTLIQGIATGPDGNLWFTMQGIDGQPQYSGFGRITTSGELTLFSGSRPGNLIVAGSDGGMWSAGTASITRIGMDGAVTSYSISALGLGSVNGLTLGPDGNVWFTCSFPSLVGRITPGGVITTFDGIQSPGTPSLFASASTIIPSPTTLTGIATGADGNLWVAMVGPQRVARITPAGAISVFDNGFGNDVVNIAAGPDGNLWMTTSYSTPYLFARATPPAPGTTNPLAVSLAGPGTVNYAPVTAACTISTGSCTTTYLNSTTVTLTAATVSTDFPFVGWLGDCTGTGTCVLNMSTPHNVTAIFSQVPLIQVFIDALPGGNVTASLLDYARSSGCTSSPNCLLIYPTGTFVSFTATPLPGFVFAGWAVGACSGSGTGTCNVTITAETFVNASFAVAPGYFELTTTANNGSITLSPSGTTPLGVCCAVYPAGTVVTLTPVAQAGSYFDHWSGACTGNGATCVVTMNKAQNVTANFIPLTPQNGYWWNPQQPGRGFFMQNNDDGMLFAAFLYDVSGSATWWAAGPSPVNSAGNFTASLWAPTGGAMLTGPFKATTGLLPSPGQVTVNFETPTTATISWPGQDTMQIQRFSFGPGGPISGTEDGYPQTGWWWSSIEPGRGYALEVQGGMMFFAGYMYDASGNPIWYSSGPAAMPILTAYVGVWEQFGFGQTLNGAWQPAQVVNTNAGSLTVEFFPTQPMTGSITFPDGRTVSIQPFAF
jgi:streptogramin lyase